MKEGPLTSKTPGERLGVLHVLISFTPGGGERAAIEVCTRLADRFRVLACCLDDAGPWASQVTVAGVQVFALQRRPGFHPSLSWRIARLAAQHNISVLHCHQYSPYVYGSLAALMRPGLRVVVTEQGRLSDAPPSRKRTLVNRVLGRVPHRVFAVSSDLGTYLIDEGFPAARVEVLHNSIDPGAEHTHVDRLEARGRLGVPEAAHVIGTVARLDPVKDLGTLIRAFGMFRSGVAGGILVIVGDGPERKILERTAADLDLGAEVRFTGHRDDARMVMAAFDQYVNCSITEGTSLTIMEAMARSLPVVATAVGGTAEIVVDGTTGVLVPSQDPEALAAAMTVIATQPEYAARLGAAGRRRVEGHFSIDRMIERYARAYTDGKGRR